MAAGLAMLQVKCKPKFFTRLAEKTAYLAAGIDKEQQRCGFYHKYDWIYDFNTF
jgi:glutamate-1-semialdehyde aminotransferase